MPSVPRPMNVMTDGIYAVCAKTYECYDGRHKCRPYEHDIITNAKGNCYKV